MGDQRKFEISIDIRTIVCDYKGMENIKTYTSADKDAVRILRALYGDKDCVMSDVLYNARQYLQDRARYERNAAGPKKVEVSLDIHTNA